MSQVSLLKLINGNNFLCVNRSLALAIGLNEAIVLSEICDKHDYFFQNTEILDEWFYLTIEDVEKRTTLTQRQQEPAIKNLIKLGFISTQIMGLPGRRHFKINVSNIEEFLFSKSKSRNDKMSQLDTTKCRNSIRQNVVTYKDKKPNKKPIEETYIRSGGNLQSSEISESEPDLPNAAAARQETFFFKGNNNCSQAITRSDIYKHFLKHKFPPDFIERIIVKFSERKGCIGNVYKVLEFIAKDLQDQDTNKETIIQKKKPKVVEYEPMKNPKKFTRDQLKSMGMSEEQLNKKGIK